MHALLLKVGSYEYLRHFFYLQCHAVYRIFRCSDKGIFVYTASQPNSGLLLLINRSSTHQKKHSPQISRTMWNKQSLHCFGDSIRGISGEQIRGVWKTQFL